MIISLTRKVIRMLHEKVRNLLVETIVQKLQPSFILLFGSFAKGIEHAKGDIDLAYYSNKMLSSYERFICASEL